MLSDGMAAFIAGMTGPVLMASSNTKSKPVLRNPCLHWMVSVNADVGLEHEWRKPGVWSSPPDPHPGRAHDGIALHRQACQMHTHCFPYQAGSLTVPLVGASTAVCKSAQGLAQRPNTQHSATGHGMLQQKTIQPHGKMPAGVFMHVLIHDTLDKLIDDRCNVVS